MKFSITQTILEDKLMRKILRLIGLLVFLSASMVLPSVAHAADKNSGQIVFVSCRNFVNNLMATDCGLSIVNADGSGLRTLTDGVDDKTPALSPDGKKVAFSSMRRDSNSEIYVVNADGTGLTRLTNRPETDISPEWSPDGKKIVFAGSLEGGDPYKRYLFMMNADGSDLKQFTKGNGFAPSWSADGKLIYYINTHNNVGDIMTVRPDGTGNIGVKMVAAMSVNPAVPSPDGKQIAFLSQKTDSDAIAANNWNDQVLLTDGYQPIFGGLSWSPDGKKLLFSMLGDGKSMKGGSRLYTVNADGSDLKPFPLECLYCYGGDWGAQAK
jgi:Tol biopolymer transport system component